MTAQKGNTVKVHYTGTLEDGTVFDTSKEREPLTFTIGEGKLIKGFDTAVEGMQVGETKTIHIKPEEGYGQRDERLVQAVPREAAKNIPSPHAGMMVGLQGPNGEQLQATIKEVGEKEITFDLNHPLAGKQLTFEITLEEIQA